MGTKEEVMKISFIIWFCVLLSMAYGEKICGVCKYTNTDDARFCGECGTTLPVPQVNQSAAGQNAEAHTPEQKINFCPNCGFKLIPGSRFCPDCGFNLKTYKKNSAESLSVHTTAVYSGHGITIEEANIKYDNARTLLRRGHVALGIGVPLYFVGLTGVLITPSYDRLLIYAAMAIGSVVPIYIGLPCSIAGRVRVNKTRKIIQDIEWHSRTYRLELFPVATPLYAGLIMRY